MLRCATNRPIARFGLLSTRPRNGIHPSGYAGEGYADAQGREDPKAVPRPMSMGRAGKYRSAGEWASHPGRH